MTRPLLPLSGADCCLSLFQPCRLSTFFFFFPHHFQGLWYHRQRYRQMAVSLSKKDSVSLLDSMSPLWIFFTWSLLFSHASTANVCNFIGGYALRVDTQDCPDSVPNHCEDGAQPRCCHAGMTCAGSNPHGGWCCQGDYDCSQDTLNEPKVCEIPPKKRIDNVEKLLN